MFLSYPWRGGQTAPVLLILAGATETTPLGAFTLRGVAFAFGTLITTKIHPRHGRQTPNGSIVAHLWYTTVIANRAPPGSCRTGHGCAILALLIAENLPDTARRSLRTPRASGLSGSFFCAWCAILTPTEGPLPSLNISLYTGAVAPRPGCIARRVADTKPPAGRLLFSGKTHDARRNDPTNPT
jgi:hypothetical protein